MRFNLWNEGECEECCVDVGSLLRWLGELNFDSDVVVDVKLEEDFEI